MLSSKCHFSVKVPLSLEKQLIKVSLFLETCYNMGAVLQLFTQTTLFITVCSDLSGFCLQTVWQLDGSVGSVSGVPCKHSALPQQTMDSCETDCTPLISSACYFQTLYSDSETTWGQKPQQCNSHFSFPRHLLHPEEFQALHAPKTEPTNKLVNWELHFWDMTPHTWVIRSQCFKEK